MAERQAPDVESGTSCVEATLMFHEWLGYGLMFLFMCWVLYHT